MPLGVYRTKKGKSIYLTGNKIAELLRKTVKSVRPDTTSEDIKRYSAHSLRFGPAFCLTRQGNPPTTTRRGLLCWLGDSFRMYLRDTLAIQLQHVKALRESLQEVMDLISALPMNVIALSTSMTNGTNDPDMNKYSNKMD